jgi:hypothetical protein
MADLMDVHALDAVVVGIFHQASSAATWQQPTRCFDYRSLFSP